MERGKAPPSAFFLLAKHSTLKATSNLLDDSIFQLTGSNLMQAILYQDGKGCMQTDSVDSGSLQPCSLRSCRKPYTFTSALRHVLPTRVTLNSYLVFPFYRLRFSINKYVQKRSNEHMRIVFDISTLQL